MRFGDMAVMLELDLSMTALSATQSNGNTGRRRRL